MSTIQKHIHTKHSLRNVPRGISLRTAANAVHCQPKQTITSSGVRKGERVEFKYLDVLAVRGGGIGFLGVADESLRREKRHYRTQSCNAFSKVRELKIENIIYLILRGSLGGGLRSCSLPPWAATATECSSSWRVCIFVFVKVPVPTKIRFFYQ